MDEVKGKVQTAADHGVHITVLCTVMEESMHFNAEMHGRVTPQTPTKAAKW